MLSPKHVSEYTQIPPSTLRRWADVFAKHLAPRSGKKRMYATSDLAVFQRIKDLAAQGIGLDRINELLLIPIEPANKETALITMTDLLQTLEFAQSTIASMNAKLEDQVARIAALEEYLALPWYKRIGKKPPVK